jgi:heme exporter protein D
MNWHSFEEFIHMGGYALYVWGSFFVVLVCLVWEVISVQSRRRHIDIFLKRQNKLANTTAQNQTEISA